MPYFGASPSSELANLDINGQKLILDADADTSITADTDDQIDIEVSGSDELKITTAMFGPASADGSALGGTSNEWSDLYLADSGVIYFGNDQDVTVTHDPDDGLFLKSTATSSSNPFVLTLQTGETDIVTNDVLGTINFQAPDEHNGTDAILVGASIRAIAEENFAADNNATAIQFLTGRSETAATIARVGSRGTFEAQSGSVSYCSFTDIDDGHTGMYFPAADTLGFVTGGTEFVRIDASGELFVGDTTNANCTQGITVNQAASDDQAIALKSSDVAHGMTDQFETDTYGILKKYGNTEGGMMIMSASDTGTIALRLQAFGASAETTKSTSGLGTISCGAYKKSSATVAVLGANENIMSVQNGGTTKFIFDSDGDFHADSSSTTFDSYDDAQLARTFDLSHNRGVISSKFDKFIAYNHEKLADLEIVGREEDGTPNHFINVTGMQRLHNGAIWQQYEKHENLLNAVYELAVEAVGEDKANEILDKNEIKLLSKNELLN